MLKIVGVVLVALAVVSVGAALLCATYVPAALRGELRDPEDVFAVIAWLLVTLLLAGSLLVASGAALRRAPPGFGLRTSALVVLSVFAVLFTVVTVIGLSSSYPSADWPLGALIAGACVLGVAAIHVRQRGLRNPAGEQAA